MGLSFKPENNNYLQSGKGETKPNVIIGGASGKFVPNVNFSFPCFTKSEKYFLNINLTSWVVDNETPVLNGQDIELTKGPLKSIWKETENGLAWDFDIIVKPASRHFDFSISCHPSLEFWKQTNPTGSLPNSHIRNPDYLNSYAVYMDRMNNGPDGSFFNGKLMHIFTPKFIDNDGVEEWGEITIDKPKGSSTGTIKISMSQNFYNNAAFPVRLDPVFGYTTIGTYSGTLSTPDICASGLGTASVTGKTAFLVIHGYPGSAPVDIYVGLYTENSGPDQKVTGSPVNTLGVATYSEAWRAYLMNGLSITQSASYWCCFQADQQFNISYDDNSGTNRYWDETASEGSWPTTFVQSTSSASRYSMYIVYEETGKLVIWAGIGNIGNENFDPTWIYQTIAGDFDVWIELIFDPVANYQTAGIIAAVDSSNFVSVSRAYDSSGYNNQVENAHTVSQSTDYEAVANSNTTVYLRLKRVGSTFSAYYANSLPAGDGDWTQITNPTGALSSSANVNIGIDAHTNGGFQLPAYFNWMKTWVGGAETIQIKNEVMSIIEGKVRFGSAVKIKDEVISIVEGLVRKANAIKIVGETISIIENLVRKGTMAPQVINEVISIIEGTVVSRILIRIKNETISIIESLVKKTWALVIVNETISVVENLVRKARSVKIINEIISIIENLVRKGIMVPQVINEVISIIEGMVVIRALIKVINETISIIEGLVRKAASVKIVNETISIIEGLVRKLSSIKIINETISIIEGIVRKATSVKLINETISIIENTLAVVFGTVVRIKNETISIVEGLVKKTWALVIMNETISIIEGLVRKASSIKIINEAISIIEGIIRKLSSVKIINETISIIENIVRKSITVKVISEVISIIENTLAIPIGVVVKIKNEVISIVEGTLKKTWALVIMNETVSIIENIVRLGWAVKIKNETVSIIEGIVRKTFSIKIINEIISIIEGTIAVRVLVRIKNEMISIIENTLSKTTVVQLINETVSIIENLVRKAASIKVVDEVISLKENIYRKLRSVKIINEAISILESSIFIRGIKIIVNETISILEEGFYVVVGLVWFKGKKGSKSSGVKRSTKSKTPERTTDDWEE